jgi:hypothetical protein
MSNIFPYQQKAEAYLTRQLNLKLGLAFSATDLIFGPVDTIAGSNDVLVTVQSSDPDRFSGSTQIRVRRQDIGSLTAGIEMRVSAPLTASVHELLPALNAKYRLALTEDDVHDESFSIGYIGPIAVRTRPESLMWTGQFYVDLLTPPAELDTVIVSGTYTDLVYPASLDTTRAVAEIRFGSIHATDVKDKLAALEVGDVIGADGVEGEYIPTLNRRPYWYVDLQTPGDNNLAGSVVSYNGANDGVYYTGDHTYASVCVIELSEECTAYAGRLVFVYN